MCVMHSNKQVISKHHFIRACFDNGETANLMLWITCPCPTLGEAKIPHKHYQFNRNPNRSRRVNKGGIKQFVTRAVVKKLYSWNLMTEETELFSQVSAPELLCKTLPRGNPDGIKGVKNSQSLWRSYRWRSHLLFFLFMIFRRCWKRPSEQHVIPKENVHLLHTELDGKISHNLCFLSRESPGLNRINSHLSSNSTETNISSSYLYNRQQYQVLKVVWQSKAQFLQTKQCCKAWVLFIA